MSKSILITGAGSGVGRATALTFLGAGWGVPQADGCAAEDTMDVDLLGRREEALRETAGLSENADAALALPTDVTDADAVEAAFAATVERFGRINGRHLQQCRCRVAAMATLAGETTMQSRPLTEVRLRFFRRRVDWLLLAVLLAATLPGEAFDWITFEKAPSSLHLVFFLAILLLSLVHLPALWTSPVMMVIGREALIWPSCYAEPIPWDAVSDVRRNGNTISVTIKEGQRFGRATTVFYRMFPEQKAR